MNLSKPHKSFNKKFTELNIESKTNATDWVESTVTTKLNQ